MELLGSNFSKSLGLVDNDMEIIPDRDSLFNFTADETLSVFKTPHYSRLANNLGISFYQDLLKNPYEPKTLFTLDLYEMMNIMFA